MGVIMTEKKFSSLIIKNPPRGIPEQHKAIIDEYFSDEYASMGDIAKKYGVSRQRIQQIISKYGYTGKKYIPSKSYRKQLPYKDKIIEMGKQGASIRKIAEDTGATTSFVIKILHENGIFAPGWAGRKEKTRKRYEEMYLYAKQNPDEPLHKIAQKFGVSYQTVVRALRMHGYYRMKVKG
jgi:predicted DNA-binding protein YlxM (UPF0122 family)